MDNKRVLLTLAVAVVFSLALLLWNSRTPTLSEVQESGARVSNAIVGDDSPLSRDRGRPPLAGHERASDPLQGPGLFGVLDAISSEHGHASEFEYANCGPCSQRLAALLLDSSRSRPLRDAAARILIQNQDRLGAAAILVAVLGGLDADCGLNTSLVRILAESDTADARIDLLEELACHSAPEPERVGELRERIAQVLGGITTEGVVGTSLARLYLSTENPEVREKLKLLESPYLSAALLADAERNGRSEEIEEGLRALARTQGATGALMFLAGESELPAELLKEALLVSVGRHRNAQREVLGEYLRSSTSSASQRTLAAEVLAALDEKGAEWEEPVPLHLN